jgi:8-oxo-dGTP pyrophosphatase MutT (NUDIX family)
MNDSSGRKVSNWYCRHRQVVYSNPWIEVSHHDVITPAGTKGIYGVVHFKNIAVGILPIDAEGNTWLVKQHRYPLEEDSWEIPEGGSPEGESLLETAQRELEEEVGLRARQWTELLTLHMSNSVTDEKAVVFVAEQLYEGKQEMEDSEDIEVCRLPLHEAIGMALDGRITDGISVAALLKLALMDKFK